MPAGASDLPRKQRRPIQAFPSGREIDLNDDRRPLMEVIFSRRGIDYNNPSWGLPFGGGPGS